MKTSTDISKKIIKRLLAHRKQLIKPLFLPLFALLLIACGDEKEAVGDVLVAAPNKGEVYVAFAGGGWRAHTGHSAWVMSLLDSDKTLDQAFTNVGSISSNSGGSWFSTMLMFSDTFALQIETPGMISNWDSIGWLGGQKKLFSNATCAKKDWWNYFPCIYKSLGLAADGAGYWKSIVEEIVYRDYQLHDSITLSHKHLDWAQDKPLLLASTMLTSSVVLNDTSYAWNPFTYERYYQACLSPTIPTLNGDSGGSCPGLNPTQVTPILFASMPRKSSYYAPEFFSYQDTSGTPTAFKLGYTEAWTKNGAPQLSNTIQNPIKTTSIPVVTAAAASSAAGGFMSMESVASQISSVGAWKLANTARDEALSFQLGNGKAEYINSVGVTFNDLNNKKVVRVADGGPTDNSGVAHMVSFLQLNQKDSAFNIVAFDNVTAAFDKGTVADVGVDIANLFGKGLQKTDEFCAASICVDIPTLTIFDPIALDTTASTWEIKHKGSDNHKLIYTQYNVNTVDNRNYNIRAGSRGTIHAFSCIWAGAETAPYDAAVFKAYSDMLDFIGESVKNGGGLTYLESAFQLK